MLLSPSLKKMVRFKLQGWIDMFSVILDIRWASEKKPIERVKVEFKSLLFPTKEMILKKLEPHPEAQRRVSDTLFFMKFNEEIYKKKKCNFGALIDLPIEDNYASSIFIKENDP